MRSKQRDPLQRAKRIGSLGTSLGLGLWLGILGGCGGNGSSGSAGGEATVPSNAAATQAVSVTVSGLPTSTATSPTPLTLVNNKDLNNPLKVSSNGSFTFAQKLATGSSYSVSVLSNPPGLVCGIASGSGNGTAPVKATIMLNCTGVNGNFAAPTPFASVRPEGVTVSTIAGTPGKSGYAAGLPGISKLSASQPASDGANLYLTDYAGNAIRQLRLSDNYLSTVVDGGPAMGFADDPTGAGTARFSLPTGIVTDGRYLYVGDSGNCAIRRVEIATKIVSTVVGQGGVCRDGFGYQDGPGSSVVLGRSTLSTGNNNDIFALGAMALSNDGKTLYFGDRNLLRQLDLASGMVTTLLGKLGNNGDSGNVDGSFTQAFITQAIFGMTADANYLYLLTGNEDHTLRKVDLAAKTISTLELFYSPTHTGSLANKNLLASIQAKNPAFKSFDTRYGLSSSFGLISDGTYLYVSGQSANQLARIRVDGGDNGIPTAIAGVAQSFGYQDGLGSVAKFAYPGGIASDGKNIYIVDQFNYVVRKVSSN